MEILQFIQIKQHARQIPHVNGKVMEVLDGVLKKDAGTLMEMKMDA